MGMFDTIKCEYPLPDLAMPNVEFQTKSFENVMDSYTITTAGRLIHHVHRWKSVPEEERPYYGKPEWDENPIFQMMGSLRTEHVEDVDTEFHGIIHSLQSFRHPCQTPILLDIPSQLYS